MLSVGDVFAIPLRSQGFGFGGIIYIDGKWGLADFLISLKMMLNVRMI